MNETLLLLTRRMLRLLPDALTALNVPALVVTGVREVSDALEPVLLRRLAQSLAAEPLPPLLDVDPPHTAQALRDAMSELLPGDHLDLAAPAKAQP